MKLMISSKRPGLLKLILLYLSPISLYKIFGDSMMPAFHSGKVVLVNRLAYLLKNPQINDIITLKDPRDGKILIKRIKKIENGKYFAIGDNKTASTDSRKFGMIEKKGIIGKVFYTIKD